MDLSDPERFKVSGTLTLDTRVTVLEDLLSKEMQERRWERYHDFLTGLPNERLMRKHIAAQGQYWFVACDLDGFKAYQDRLKSHEAGDKVLKAFGDFLQSCTRSGDATREGDNVRLPVRLHGDEFVVITRTRKGAEAIAGRIMQWSHKGVTASCGVDRTTDGADRAMYKAKRARKRAKHARLWLAAAGILAAVGILFKVLAAF